jgi:hypothetical protein
VIIKDVNSLARKTAQKICLSVGAEEPDEFLGAARMLRKALTNKGWKENVDFSYLEAPGIGHSPGDNTGRVDHLFRFLFSQ